MRNSDKYMLEFIRIWSNMLKISGFFDMHYYYDSNINAFSEEENVVVTYKTDEVIEEKVSEKEMTFKLEKNEYKEN